MLEVSNVIAEGQGYTASLFVRAIEDKTQKEIECSINRAFNHHGDFIELLDPVFVGGRLEGNWHHAVIRAVNNRDTFCKETERVILNIIATACGDTLDSVYRFVTIMT